MSHTPPPWLHEPASQQHGHYISDASGQTICDLYFLSRQARNVVEFINAEENARLIEVAPDLLDALTRILEELPSHTNDHDWMEDGLRRAVESARVVIAKAEGEAT